LTYQQTKERETARGFKQQIFYYQTHKCKTCSRRESFNQGRETRTIQVNHRLRKAKEKVIKNLKSEQGIKYRKQRPADVEPVFGQIKSNKGFRRFNLRGLKKVEVETGLLAIAHNLKKLAA
jgi:hypothetical protein